jgi:ribonuclease P protein component
MPLVTLRQRADYLRAARALHSRQPGFVLQARPRNDGTNAVRVGFTCSKKVGNAVARNRAKRRLREISRTVLPSCGRPGWDYVLVGLANKTAERPFEALGEDLHAALTRVHPKAT